MEKVALYCFKEPEESIEFELDLRGDGSIVISGGEHTRIFADRKSAVKLLHWLITAIEKMPGE